LSLILLTQDQLAINYVGRTSAEIRQDFAARQLEIAEMVLEETEATNKQFASQRTKSVPSESELVRARTDLRQASRLLESGDASHAIPLAARCREICRRIRRASWEATVLNFPSPVSSPLCTSFSTLPLHFAAADRLARTPWSVNALPAGEMEQMDHLIDSGWRLLRADTSDVEIDARLTLEAPHAGRFSLQLRAWEAGESRRGLAGQWPLTISSAPVPVRSGELVRIHGWVKVPRRFSNSWDGLMIFDSQSGPDLAERILETQGWQEFVLYRAATATGDLHVVFAQTGLGEAWLDDISVTLHAP
jgi:hypothetical protein